MAYKIFDLNNGYPIDCAPNGKKSILFQQLDERFGREEAIRLKTSAYTNTGLLISKEIRDGRKIGDDSDYDSNP